MKKKKQLVLLLNAIPLSLFAANSSAVNDTGFFSKVWNALSSFKDSASIVFSDIFSYLGTKFSEFGTSFLEFCSSFAGKNKQAWNFFSTTGWDFFKSYWLEITGSAVLAAGIIFLICSLAFKPKYRLQNVPSNAVPLKPEPKAPLDSSSLKPEKAVSSQVYSSSEAINPVDIPHVEKYNENLDFLNDSDLKKSNHEDDVFETFKNNPEIDQEDLEFFSSLSKDFNLRNQTKEK